MKDEHPPGLLRDLRTMSRRQMFRWLGGAALVPLVGCAGQSASGPDAADAPVGGGSCAAIPEETGGPYPGDGTNGPNALSTSGVVRSDIGSSFGTASGVAAGVPLTVTLTITDSKNGCAPLANHAVYIWHCDRDGDYSMYTGAATSENYLRGVQATDASGKVTFTTIFPACYSGRWPHIHFEIYESLAAATSGKNAVATSQLALPKATCDEVYATSGYSASVSNLSKISLASDLVFSDGATQETPAVSGSVASGYTATLDVAV